MAQQGGLHQPGADQEPAGKLPVMDSDRLIL